MKRFGYMNFIILWILAAGCSSLPEISGPVVKTENNTAVLNGKGRLTIHFRNVDNDKGNLMILVVNEHDANGFPEVKNPEVALVVPAIKGVTSVEIPELSYGNYAISVFHDEDRDGTLDYLLGFNGAPGGVAILPSWPTEGYGFSNTQFTSKDYATPGPPSFKVAKFEFNEYSKQDVDVYISYFWKKFGLVSIVLIGVVLGAIGL